MKLPPTGTAAPAPDAPYAATRAAPSLPPAGSLHAELLALHGAAGALLAAPEEAGPRRGYFAALARFASVRTGLGHALLPELGHPLAFRCAAPDLAALTRCFGDGFAAFPLRSQPRRILVLGAGCGYLSVALACRFPEAELAAVEPLPALRRVLVQNTAPYRRIRLVAAAVWHSRARLGVVREDASGWLARFGDRLPAASRRFQAETVDSLLALLGWGAADLVVADFPGAAEALLAVPGQSWVANLDALAIVRHQEKLAPPVPPLDKALLEAGAFAVATHQVGRHAPVDVAERLAPRRLPVPGPRRLALVQQEPGVAPLELVGVMSEPWGFFLTGEGGFQLHPPLPGAIAEARFARTLAGHTRLETGLAHAGPRGEKIRFTVSLETEAGEVVAREAQVLAPGESRRLALGFAPVAGRHRAVLATAMAEGAAHNAYAWARFEDPAFA